MSKESRRSLPDWAGALFAGAMAIGSGAGVYATLLSDISSAQLEAKHNAEEIAHIKNELVAYNRLVDESRILIHKLSTDVAVTKAQVDALKKTQEAAIRAIERMSVSAERLTVAIARLDERLKKKG